MIGMLDPIDLILAACLLAIAVPFVFYPLVLWAHARLAPAPIDMQSAEPADRAKIPHLPHVDLIIAAHDEAASIGARLENALALDYPPERLTIWVASDGSTDATVEIARGFEARAAGRIRVLDLPRGGKAAALRAAVEASAPPVAVAGAAANEVADDCDSILAFSDANSEWSSNAMRALVRPLVDPRVGGVAGDQRYLAQDALRGTAVGERSYWSFDRQLKQWQSASGSAISATGAIYAIRRALFESPPPDATDDFMISTGVIAQGQRLVFNPEAVAFEPPAPDDRGEFRRKVRIITRGLRAVAYRRALLDPRKTGFYAIELLLHKVWRRLTWIPLALIVLLAPVAVISGALLVPVAIAILLAVLLGTLGIAIPSATRLRIVAAASYVVMVNAACAFATLNAVRGHRVARWETDRASRPTAREPLP